MSLIQCPMCGKMISPNAEACPNCGEPMKKETNKQNDRNDPNRYLWYLEKSHIEEDTDDNKIRCPNCHSGNVHKISVLSKAGSVALIGVFAMGKISKTYECDKCGYRW